MHATEHTNHKHAYTLHVTSISPAPSRTQTHRYPDASEHTYRAWTLLQGHDLWPVLISSSLYTELGPQSSLKLNSHPSCSVIFLPKTPLGTSPAFLECQRGLGAEAMKTTVISLRCSQLYGLSPTARTPSCSLFPPIKKLGLPFSESLAPWMVLLG